MFQPSRECSVDVQVVRQSELDPMDQAMEEIFIRQELHATTFRQRHPGRLEAMGVDPGGLVDRTILFVESTSKNYGRHGCLRGDFSREYLIGRVDGVIEGILQSDGFFALMGDAMSRMGVPLESAVTLCLSYPEDPVKGKLEQDAAAMRQRGLAGLRDSLSAMRSVACVGQVFDVHNLESVFCASKSHCSPAARERLRA